MDEPFFTSARSDALRWLAMADRQLEALDLHGSKSFAQSSRKAEPSLEADRILAIVDTLLGAERRRYVNNQPDWFAVLHLTPLERLDPGLISRRFQRLRDLLDPRTNKHPFAEQAFNLIHQAYANLIHPPGLTRPQQLPGPINAPMPAALPQSSRGSVGGSNSAQPAIQTHNFMGLFSRFNIGSRPGHVSASKNLDVGGKGKEKEEDRVEEERIINSPVAGDGGSTFWTACPYCYYMYEYPKVYINCAMRCQKCRRAFHGVVIRSPYQIVVVDGKESYHFSRGEDGQGTSN